MEKVILRGLVELNLANGYEKKADEIASIAHILARDLAEESKDVVARAFDYLRKNCHYWPKVSDLLDACDKVRTQADRTFIALPPPPPKQITPGMGTLANKFWREGRSADEFDAAATQWSKFYNESKKDGWKWPANKQEYEEYATQLFGVRETQRDDLLKGFAANYDKPSS